jgi:ribosomal protein S18 acetylase RimI-like enzyme
MSSTLTVTQALPDELPAVLAILDDCAAWLHEQGIEQWPDRFSGRTDWRSDRIAKYVDDGETWLVRDAGELVATFTLNDSADPDFAAGWPGGTGSELYIYRMAVLREHAGQSIGASILQWATARAADAGVQWLRLDCHRANGPLQRYYERNGFQRVGTVVRPPRGSGALYQRAVGSCSVCNAS